jgi:23S rRNA pseudouridine2605 synthase
MEVRVNKFLANLGFSSRRNISQFLKEHILLVNGKRISKPGVRVDPEKDQVLLDGQELEVKKEYIYIILYKPKGVISSVKDEHGRKTVVDLVKSSERIYPVGRLDQDTTGLILLTNDGELTQKLTHPSSHVPKTYMATLTGAVPKRKLEVLRSGVNLKDGKTQPAEVEVLEPPSAKAMGGKENPKRSVLKITIYEGRNHQIKRMLAVLKLNLISLKRVGIGNIELGDLKIGEFRELSEEEVDDLKV